MDDKPTSTFDWIDTYNKNMTPNLECIAMFTANISVPIPNYLNASKPDRFTIVSHNPPISFRGDLQVYEIILKLYDAINEIANTQHLKSEIIEIARNVLKDIKPYDKAAVSTR